MSSAVYHSSAKPLGVLFEREAALDDFDALFGVGDAANVHGQAKAVEELRAEFAFFGIHRADEHELGGMLKRDAFAFDDVDAHRRRIEQEVDDVVVEQVDFVHVQNAAIGVGEDARLEFLFAFFDGGLDVERADDAVFGGADGQIHQTDFAASDGQDFAACLDVPGIRRTGVSRGDCSQSGNRRRLQFRGASAARARTAVDLAVPRSPRINTPPMSGLIALSINARFMRS